MHLRSAGRSRPSSNANKGVGSKPHLPSPAATAKPGSGQFASAQPSPLAPVRVEGSQAKRLDHVKCDSVKLFAPVAISAGVPIDPPRDGPRSHQVVMSDEERGSDSEPESHTTHIMTAEVAALHVPVAFMPSSSGPPSRSQPQPRNPSSTAAAEELSDPPPLIFHVGPPASGAIAAEAAFNDASSSAIKSNSMSCDAPAVPSTPTAQSVPTPSVPQTSPTRSTAFAAPATTGSYPQPSLHQPPPPAAELFESAAAAQQAPAVPAVHPARRPHPPAAQQRHHTASSSTTGLSRASVLTAVAVAVLSMLVLSQTARPLLASMQHRFGGHLPFNPLRPAFAPASSIGGGSISRDAAMGGAMVGAAAGINEPGGLGKAAMSAASGIATASANGITSKTTRSTTTGAPSRLTTGGGAGGGRTGGDVSTSAMSGAADSSSAGALPAGNAGAVTSTAPVPADAPGQRKWRPDATVRVVSVVSRQSASPFAGASWGEVTVHMAKRLGWTDPTYQMLVFYDSELGGSSVGGSAGGTATTSGAVGGTGGTGDSEFLAALNGGAQILVGIDVQQESAAQFLRRHAAELPAVRLFFDSAAEVQALSSLQGLEPFGSPNAFQMLVARAAGSLTPYGRSLQLLGTVQELFQRHTSDDLLFVYLVLMNQYVTRVPKVADSTKGFDLPSLACMIRHCWRQVAACIGDTVCKTALDCLQGCSFNDQVCQYRCIVSYENPQLEQFTLCILQKHNCRNLDAKPPTLPVVRPMTQFRGQPLTHEAAEGIFLGWLAQPGHVPLPGKQQQGQEQQQEQQEQQQQHQGSGDSLPYSWLVAGGVNPAYDAFPAQHQLFSRGKGKGVLWYEPVFKVIALDGRPLWRRRRYRVKRAGEPGTFNFSVLDNGVTSNEYWRIVDAGDDLSWALFYYTGAASTAGMSYSGAVLATPDGAMPKADQLSRLDAALQRAGLERWELSLVDNSDVAGAPLAETVSAQVAAGLAAPAAA